MSKHDKTKVTRTDFMHEKTGFLHMRKQKRRSAVRLCFRYIDGAIPLFLKSEIFCGCTAWFVWDLVGNPEDRFSHEARIATVNKYQNLN